MEFVEAGLHHAAAERGDDRRALHDVGVELVAPEVEEAVLEPRLLRVLGVAEHRQRQLAGGRQHLDIGGEDLDRAGRQVRVDRILGPRLDRTVDPDHPFGAHRLGGLEGRRVRVGDHLGQAVVVAQVDEQEAAVVAHPVDPAGEADGLADVSGAERATGVGPVGVHGGFRLWNG